MNTAQTTTCRVCGGTNARNRRVARSYGRGAKLLVIENVPIVSCPDCGESYMTAQNARELDRLKGERNSAALLRQVPVATFAS
jgi:YgiT-type zinc finger domain-containing protein